MIAASADSMPPWLSALGVKSGEYFIDSKLRARRALQSKSFSPAARIHICLGLATMGFQQELAVKMEGGKRVPLSPADVCAATGIRREHFRRHMAELEAMGLAQCRGLAKGHIEIYSWALPRSVSNSGIVTARGDNSAIVCEDGGPVSDTLLSVLTHCRIRGGFHASRGDIAELERLAQVTKDAELSLRAYAESLRAQRVSIGKKETVINKERNDERTMEQSAAHGIPATPEPEFGGTSVVSLPVKKNEKLRTWLTAHAEQFGLLTAPDTAVISQIGGYINDDEAIFARFERQILKQRPRPDSWMYFVPIAKACAEAHAAAVASLPAKAGKAAAVPPGFTEAVANRIGEGSLESFRETTGNSEATFEDLDAVYGALLTEFGIELNSVGVA